MAAEIEIGLEYANGVAFVPFDIRGPHKYLPTISFLRQLFNERLGADLIVRFLGSSNLGDKLYLHIQRWDLSCNKLNVGDETIGDPWVLGSGDTDRHIGVTESYDKAKVGYQRLQIAVDGLIGSLNDLEGLVLTEDIRRVTNDQEWGDCISSHLTSLLFMTIEPVRLPRLSTQFYLYDMAVKSNDHFATAGEVKMVTSWGSTSEARFRKDKKWFPKMKMPIKYDSIREAELDANLARVSVAVPCIKGMKEHVNHIARDFKEMGLNIQGLGIESAG